MIINEIKNICSPKGEQGGISFIINYLIIFLTLVISNYLGFLITVPASEYKHILIFKILTFLLLILSIFLILVFIFNYKRRFLSITGNLPLSIALAIFFGLLYEIFTYFIYFSALTFFIGKVIIPLVVSIIPPKNSDKKEYWQTFFNRVKKFFKNPITIFVIVMLIFDFCLVKYSIYRNEKISKIIPTEKMEKLVINPLSQYSGKTKEEILNIRKSYVKTSIFSSENYKPSEYVFGKIEDKKAWWGIDYTICSKNSTPTSKIATGNSEESRYINNPNLLVGVQLSKCYNNSNGKISDFCNDKTLLLIPTKLNYDKKNKLLIATYKSSPNFLKTFKKQRARFFLVGLNAKDFGYNWVYANKLNEIKILPTTLEFNTIDVKPRLIKSFIHVGQNCKVEGGCNNGSPYQPELEFIFKNLPADITLSLWKKKPIFKNQPADFYIKMIFE